MRRMRTTTFGIGLGLAAGWLGCGGSHSSTAVQWNCQSVEVPAGQSVECVSSEALAAVGTTTTCSAGDPGCPPVGTTVDGPPPASADGGGTTQDGVPGADGGSGSGTGGGGALGEDAGMGGTLPTGSSPECTVTDLASCTTLDGPGPGGDGGSGGGSDDAGLGGGGGSGDASLGDDGGGSGGGSGDASLGGGGGGGDLTGGDAGQGGGHGNGNGSDAGNGNGGGGHSGGGSNGNGGGGSHSGGNGNGGSNGNGGGNHGGGSSTPDGGAGGSGGHPPFTCVDTNEGRDCISHTPTCLPSTHASACGACIPDGTTEDCLPPTEGGCWVTGGGFIVDNGDQNSFGGNAKPMQDGSIQGEWEDVDHATGHKAHGEPSYLVCRHVPGPGPGQPGGKKGFTDNQAYYGGPARWFDGTTWNDGYWFDVVVEDHGEGQAPPDSYQITVRLMNAGNSSGAIVYQASGDLSGGNIQLHPPNNGHPYASSSLPSWVQLQP